MKGQDNTRESTNSNHQIYEVPQSMKKKFYLREIFFTTYHCCRLGLAIAIIVLMLQTNTTAITDSEGFQRMQEVLDIWGKDVIVDMITTSTYNCPQGYEMYTSVNWPGTKEGCLCQISFNEYDYAHVLPAQCSLKLMNAGCVKILPKQPISFAFWKTDKLICIKRIKGLNFFTDISQLSESGNTKLCGQSSYEFQSIKQQQCPITSMSNTTAIYPNILSDIQFSFSREDNYPIADLRISEYQFCIDYDSPNISPNRFDNYNLQLRQISHCEQVDPRTVQIDEITQKQLFQNNERIYDLVMQQLPIFPQPTDDYVYKMGITRYPPWNAACRKSEQFSINNAKVALEMDEASSEAEYAIDVSIFIICIWGFLYTLLCIIRRVGEIKSRQRNHILYLPDSQVMRINPNLLSSGLKLNLCGQIIVFLLLMTLAIGLLVNIGVQYQKTDGFQSWMRQSQKCMDDTTYLLSWLNSGYITFLQKYIRNYMICIICVIVIACLDLIFSIWRLQKGDLAMESFSSLFEPDEDPISKKDSDEDKFNEKSENDKQMSDNTKKRRIDSNNDLRKTVQIFNPTQQSLNYVENDNNVGKLEDLDDEFNYERPALGKRKSKIKGSKKKKPRQLEYFDFE